MKTKELIKRLQKADPSGEIECCVVNQDIISVYKSEAYWDGCLQVLKRNEEITGYNIVGAEWRSGGDKIIIEPYSIDAAVSHNPELVVTYDSDYTKKNYHLLTEEYRLSAIKLNESCSKGLFIVWAKNKYANHDIDCTEHFDIETIAGEYFESSLKDSYQGQRLHDLYHDWEQSLTLNYDGGWKFERRNI